MSIYAQRYSTGTCLRFEDGEGRTVDIRETGLFRQVAPGKFEALIELESMTISQSTAQELLPYLARFAETGKFEEVK